MIMTQTGVTTVSPHVGAGLVPALVFFFAFFVVIASNYIYHEAHEWHEDIVGQSAAAGCPYDAKTRAKNAYHRGAPRHA